MTLLANLSVRERRYFWRGFWNGVIWTIIFGAWIVSGVVAYMHSPAWHP